jgi:hypothetical protein
MSITTSPEDRQPTDGDTLAARVHDYVTDRVLGVDQLRQELLAQGIITPEDALRMKRNPELTVGVLIRLADGKHIFVSTYGEVI